MAEYDVIIVGGGISGLLSALTLSKHGKKVLILEKDNEVGAIVTVTWWMVSRWTPPPCYHPPQGRTAAPFNG